MTKISYKKNYTLEQYSRRNNLLVFGVAETKTEDIKQVLKQLIRQKLVKTINEEDLDRVHRIGSKKAGTIRSIIVKFCKYYKHSEILRAK